MIATKSVTYEISLEEIKAMLVKALNLSANSVEVVYEIKAEHHGDPRDSWQTHKVTGIKVVQKPNTTQY